MSLAADRAPASEAPAAAGASGDKLARVRLESFFASAGWVSGVNLLNAVIFALLMRDSVDWRALAAWVGLLAVLGACRLEAARRFWLVPAHARLASPWPKVPVLIALGFGLAWGALGLTLDGEVLAALSLDAGVPPSREIPVLFLAGMAAGASVSLYTVPPAHLVYVCLVLLPGALVIAGDLSAESVGLAGIFVVFLVFLVVAGRQAYARVSDSLRMRFVNEALVEQLTAEVDERERLNAALRQARDDLERRVRERTEELRRAVGDLEDEIRQRESVENRLIQAQKMEAVGQLTRGIAHDFNNLLTVVLGNLHLLHEDLEGDEALRHRAERAMRAAASGAELTRRLLAFSRQQPLKPEVLDVNALVTDCGALLERSLGQGIEVAIETAPDLWPVTADRGQLENALINLAINARDAMAEGGRLTLRTENAALDQAFVADREELTAGDYVLVSVADTGVGIAPETLGRVLDPFFTTKPPGKGSGLGLSMAYGFAKQSGGHLEVASAPNHGTTVRLYLRRSATEDAAVGMPASPHAAPSGEERILVVEDEPEVRRILLHHLTSLGYQVTAVDDAEAALEHLRGEGAVDLLFTDVALPGGMNGFELAQRAIEQRAGLRILYCSGHPRQALAFEGRLPLGIELLAKPFTRDELALRVRRALDS